jgi:hypothetical protein
MSIVAAYFSNDYAEKVLAEIMENLHAFTRSIFPTASRCWTSSTSGEPKRKS